MKTSFQGKITFTSVTPFDSEMRVWVADLTFFDADGAYTGVDVIPGDVLSVDTSIYEIGTFSFYKITSVLSSDPTVVQVVMEYIDANDHVFGPPDATTFIGMDGMVSRPSSNFGLLPVVSTALQNINDKFTEYVQNYNFVQIVDKMLSGNRVYTKVNGEAGPLLKGMVVYINGSNSDQCLAASATTQPSSDVLGLVADVIIAPGMSGVISSGSRMEKTTSDWDIITGGTGGLIPGKDYFLRADFPGGIHYVPPQDTGNFIVKIGKAVSSTILDINIDQPIEL